MVIPSAPVGRTILPNLRLRSALDTSLVECPLLHLDQAVQVAEIQDSTLKCTSSLLLGVWLCGW